MAAAVVATACALLTGGGAAFGNPAHGAAGACGSHVAAPAKVARFGGIVRPVKAGRTCVSITGDPFNSGGEPPLIFHGGPVMGTRATSDRVVVTPIFWAGAGYSFTTSYTNLIVQYLNDAAADSERSSNVFSTLFEYHGSNGNINYRFKVGTPVNDTTAFPAPGCTTNAGSIYADGTGYTTCLDDAQVIHEAESVVTASSLPRDYGHLYVVFLPKHVESCFFAGNPANQACTINATPSGAYCAYHSRASSGMVYANLPFPVYRSAVGFSCTDEHLNGDLLHPTIQSPNGEVDGDVEISPLSHEMSEAITDPDTITGWYDNIGFENGDECAYVYGALAGSNGGFYNQTVNGHHYLTQEEFSNADFKRTGGGCLPVYVPAAKPSITALSSHSGSRRGGASITIGGKGFAGATSVKFGTTSVPFTIVDSGRIKVTTPAHAAGKVDVRVTNSVGTSAIVTADKYTFS
jgi:IPT/TIG domain-containing protein